MAEANDPPLILLEVVHLQLAKYQGPLSEFSERLFKGGCSMRLTALAFAAAQSQTRPRAQGAVR